MKIQMQESELATGLSFTGCDIAIVGKAVDDRGRAIINYLESKTADICCIDYDVEKFEFDVNGQRINADDIEDFLGQFRNKSIALEATTLGFVEIFLSCRALKELGFSQITFFYVEPQHYRSPNRSKLLHKRDFELSDKFPGYCAIPHAAYMLNDRYQQSVVFFLGYEERRLDRALEDFQMIKPGRCSVVFGVPAFKPGWEMDAFANNIRVIRDKNIRGGVHFCGAENPLATVELLEHIYNSLGKEELMFIAPIGTKPNGIGIALFVSNHPNVGILYDHPKKKEGRSEAISKWHLFDVDFSKTL